MEYQGEKYVNGVKMGVIAPTVVEDSPVVKRRVKLEKPKVKQNPISANHRFE